MADRKRKRAAEWEWRERGRRRMTRKREGREEERQVGWTSDPMEALGEDVMGRVMEFLDARSVARCTAVSRAWRGVAADNRLWAPKVRFGRSTPLYFASVGLRRAGWLFVLLLFDELLPGKGNMKPSISSSSPSSTLVLKFE